MWRQIDRRGRCSRQFFGNLQPFRRPRILRGSGIGWWRRNIGSDNLGQRLWIAVNADLANLIVSGIPRDSPLCRFRLLRRQRILVGCCRRFCRRILLGYRFGCGRLASNKSLFFLLRRARGTPLNGCPIGPPAGRGAAQHEGRGNQATLKESHFESKSQRLTSVHVKHPQSTHNEKPAIAMRNGFNSPAGGIDDADKSPRRKGIGCNDGS